MLLRRTSVWHLNDFYAKAIIYVDHIADNIDDDIDLYTGASSIRVKHEMHHGQNRGKQRKRRLSQKPKLNENRGIYL